MDDAEQKASDFDKGREQVARITPQETIRSTETKQEQHVLSTKFLVQEVDNKKKANEVSYDY